MEESLAKFSGERSAGKFLGCEDLGGSDGEDEAVIVGCRDALPPRNRLRRNARTREGFVAVAADEAMEEIVPRPRGQPAVAHFLRSFAFSSARSRFRFRQAARTDFRRAENRRWEFGKPMLRVIHLKMMRALASPRSSRRAIQSIISSAESGSIASNFFRAHS